MVNENISVELLDNYTEDEKNILKEKRKKYELLLPAGDMEKAKFAIEFGADAIYAGIPMFTLRGKSNMSLDELKVLVPYAHKRGVKVYLAVNIFPHSFKYKQFLKDMEIMVNEVKPDAFIMADPGLIDVTRTLYPDVEIHLSVQANAINWMAINFWKKVGIKRVILPRELTYNEVLEIEKNVKDIELEFFVHGSNCIAYSGRCLLSNYFNYRDSNQGVCNNACRYNVKLYKSNNKDYLEPLQDKSGYKKIEEGTYFIESELRKGELYEITEDENGTYLLNSKDNCMLEHLEKLMKAGICSFKVEGRTKSTYYVSIVGRVYRKVLNDLILGKKPDFDWAFNEISSTSNRGFMPGFLEGNPKENSVLYEKKYEDLNYLYVGLVKKIRSSNEEKNETILEVEPKSKIKIGDELEIVTPTKTIYWKCDNLEKEVFNGENIKLKEVSGGTEFNVLIKIPILINENFLLIRKKIN